MKLSLLSFFLIISLLSSCKQETKNNIDNKRDIEISGKKLTDGSPDIIPELKEVSAIEKFDSTIINNKVDTISKDRHVEISKNELKPKTPVKEDHKVEPVIRKVKKTKKYKPEIEFDETLYDFGEITEGDIIKHKFTFTNSGNSVLKFENASGTCGCTQPSFPFLDIAPGEKGYIGVTYNSVGKDGEQSSEITVYANTIPKTRTLYLKGKVVPKKKDLDSNPKVELVKDTID